MNTKIIVSVLMFVIGIIAMNYSPISDPHFHILGFGMTNHMISGLITGAGFYFTVKYIFIAFRKPVKKKKDYPNNHPIM